MSGIYANYACKKVFAPFLQGLLGTYHDKEARSKDVRDENERYDDGQTEARSNAEEILNAEGEPKSIITVGCQEHDRHQECLRKREEKEV